jgi:hypothetical protein
LRAPNTGWPTVETTLPRLDCRVKIARVPPTGAARPPFFTYLGVHLYYPGGQMGHRVEMLIKWIAGRFGERQGALIEDELPDVERASPAVR